ncbi:calcium/sodium antiporter [Actinomadura scrupuli]|uniref:calcium/sodium antiporter n=1 Tax=Actinomadura scrupuli TaxID=559629 RepID=UPI003D99B9C1
MLISLAVLVAGLPLLTLGADQLVLGSARIARRAGWSAVTVGVVVIGFGTSAPELLVSGTAAAQGHAGLAVGNLVGSNVINLTLVLGLAGLVAPVLVRSSVLRREAPLSVGAVAVFAVLLLRGLDVAAGVVLAVLLAAVTVWMLRVSRERPGDVLATETAEFLDGSTPHRLPIEVARTVLGLVGTLTGTQLLVVGGSDLATRIGLSQQLIGFTLVAFGTSLPELVTTLQAQRRGEADLLVGNLLGSNLLNSLAGGAVVAFAAPARVDAGGAAVVAVMAGVSGLAWALLARGQRLTRLESLAMAVVYVLALPLLL